uniref:NADH-ubiquinone oxidoreductase chain 4 n=1 Tax=Xenobates singaporensis TaxID=3081716 RepID=A0AB38Z6V2_9HEMI|nr:NADH dehydrogenase subunit 4 [Xenobates singaporensis]WPW47186.1 NADH dehydrogenase subunit 4 [Xenobates singaporensis]
MMKMFFTFFLMLPMIFLSNWTILIFSMILFFLIFLNMNFMLTYFSCFSYLFMMDLLSGTLIYLTIWITLLMILSSYSVNKNNNFFLMLLIFLMIFLIMTFSTTNVFLFYIFFESSLIPTLLLIFGWGYQPERLSAGFYLLFYTLFGSLPLLLSIFYIYNFNNSLCLMMIYLDYNFYLYLGLILAFLIKMPMMFFHFWLPKAHVEAPISGSMILAGVLLKLGGYGLMRVFKFLNGNYLFNNMFFICLSLFSMMIIGVICMFQVDMKSLIAYSSVSHMALVICGIFSLNYFGMLGALILMIGHGLCSSGLFCLANIMYERSGSRSFYFNKGFITLMPSLSFFMFLLCANNMASPPSLNLLGEIMIINSIMSWCNLSFIYLFMGSFLSCCYSVYLYSYTQHGQLFFGLKSFSGINVRELMLLFLHWLPLNILIMKIDIFLMWL